MFALKSENKLEIVENKNHTTHSVRDKILYIYNKLKKIAKSEINSKNKFKPANLTNSQLNQLKSLESNIGLCLVAYEDKDNFLKQKVEILNRINNLLNDYSKLIAQNEKKIDSNEDFSKFFE